MANLLKETLLVLEQVSLTPGDVNWVGSRDGKYAISWEQFESIANVEYDAGYGGQEIVVDLVVVGSGWWLSRGEYDGSEWWNYNSPPAIDADHQPFTKVKDPHGSSWVSIEEAQRPGGKYGDDDESQA